MPTPSSPSRPTPTSPEGMPPPKRRPRLLPKSARTDNVAFIEAFAAANLPGTDEAAARSLLNATSVTGSLQGFNWERLKPLIAAEKQKDQRGADAKAALDRLRGAL